MINNETITGLYASGLGITIVFIVLSLLATTVYLLKYIPLIIEKKKIKISQTPLPEEEEKTLGVESVSGKPEITPQFPPETIALITAAITGFIEYKRKKLEKYELFREFPSMQRILPFAGIFFEADIKVSIGGVDKVVHVKETPSGYIVRIDNREYNVSYTLSK